MELSTTLIPLANSTQSSDYHRIALPFYQMGVHTNRRPVKDQIAYFNRVFPLNGVKTGRFILDLDDYWILDKSNPFYQTWKLYRISEQIIDNIKNALAVTVTNTRLADKVKNINKNVHVIPNALPFDKGQFGLTEPDFSKLVYAGGKSHERDIQLLSDLPVQYYGGLKGSPSLPLSVYMSAYNHKGIALVPLYPSTFNACKSNLKILEAGAKGLACMCSEVDPYIDPGDKEAVLYAAGSFKNTLKKLREDDLRGNAEELAEYVRQKYDLTEVNKLRVDILNHYAR